MSITNIAGLWCDDITFCQEECERTDCPRNQKNIRDRTIPHSFSVERPTDCLKVKKTDDTVVFTSIEDELISLIVEYLCEDHTESELMGVVDKAIKYSNGEKEI